LTLLLALVPTALAAPRVVAVAASAGRTLAAAARSVDAGGRLTVTGLVLEGQAGDSTLELQRLEAWDPAAKIVVHPGSGAPPITEGPPDTRYFQGSLAGVPASTVMLAVDAAGGVSGMAVHGRHTWLLGRPALSPQAAAAGVAPAGLASRKAVPDKGGAAGRRPFQCQANDLLPQRTPQARPAGTQAGAYKKLLATSQLTASLALETDGELYKVLGGTKAAVTSYVGQLVAYASIVFKKEIGVELRITWCACLPGFVAPCRYAMLPALWRSAHDCGGPAATA
jgi:hypothetical protein